MPAIYSQARADLYNMAFELQPGTLINTADMLPHLADLLRTRICPNKAIPDSFTARKIVDYLAPTFGEARDIAVFREASLQHCLDLQDKTVKYIKPSDLCAEIIDYLHDLLPNGTTESGIYNVWDVICALRPDFEELREEARRDSHEQLPRWQRVIQSKKKLGGDDDFPF